MIHVYNRKNRVFGSLATIVLPVLLLSTFIIIISVGQYVKAQYSDPYCQGKKDEMISRAGQWSQQWETALSDPNGQIRADGKQLTSEIGLTLANCNTSLNDHDKLTLTQAMDVINAEIDKDINYGPPCNPLCQSGPPIS